MMKHIFFVPIILLLSNAVNAQDPSLTALDKKYGFRDLKFGADTANIKGMRLKGIYEDGTSYYERSSDNKNVGTGMASIITYRFYKGKLQEVELYFEGKPNIEAMRTAMQELYGYGTPHESGMILWNGKLVTAAIFFFKDSEMASLTIYSNPIMAQQANDIAASKANKSGL